MAQQEIGLRCNFSRSGEALIWERVYEKDFSEAWKREIDGTIWVLKILSGNYISPSEAREACRASGFKLPSAKHFINESTFEVRRILNIVDGHYWTSSFVSGGGQIFLNGWGGSLSEYESYRIPPKHAICVK